MTIIYISNLNANYTLNTAGVFGSDLTTTEGVNSNDLDGGKCTLEEVGQAFKFYTTTDTDGGNGINYNGAIKTTTNFNNPPLEVGRNDMLELLAEAVFGSASATGLFDNSLSIESSFDIAAGECLDSVNSANESVSLNAGAEAQEFVNGLLTVMPERFELKYKNSRSVNLPINSIFGDIDNDLNQESSNTTGITYKVQTPDGEEEGANGTVVIESNGVGEVLRITTLVPSTDRLVKKGDKVLITIPAGTTIKNTTNNSISTTSTDITITLNGYSNFTGVNSVQAAMLNGTLDALDENGTLDSSLYTEAPVEAGDSIRVKYAIGSESSQKNASGEFITVCYTSYIIFTAAPKTDE